VSHWLNNLPAPTHERVLVSMRETRTRADGYRKECERILPPEPWLCVHSISHIDPFAYSEGLYRFLGALGKGATPDEARQAGHDEAAGVFRKFNAQRKKDYMVHRWEESADDIIDFAWRRLLQAAQELPQESPTMPSIDERLALLSGLQVFRDRITAARKREEEARELRFAAENDFEHAWSALMGQAAPAPAQPITLSPLAAQSAPPGTVVSLDSLHGLTPQQLNRTHLPSLFAQQIARPVSLTPVVLHGSEWVCVSLTDTTWDLRALFPRPQWQASYQREWDMQSRLEDLPPRDPANVFSGLLISTPNGDRVVGFAPGLTLSSTPGVTPPAPASEEVEEAPVPKKRARRKKEPATDPQTLDNLLRASLMPDDEAIARWTAHRQQGLPDGLLLASIAAEWGCGGNLDYGANGQCSFQGVPAGNPAFWLNLDHQGAPTLEGQAMVETVRRVLGIPLPKDEAEEADLFSAQARKEGAA
jgi:hypothetical protein